ncbi:MAG: hypothetical protein COB67_07120 [SAR324 cluster bacterium]|uniref:Phosphatidylcholine 1-acylhydrolase n=1 Tax=SAR324 cluster bacterium TaxID=2024889 RepID=A0A2A4T514_9DELT|nr:MAG: hypothetical protein COB67_07120 [SAR324 cluster bacterium]
MSILNSKWYLFSLFLFYSFSAQAQTKQELQLQVESLQQSVEKLQLELQSKSKKDSPSEEGLTLHKANYILPLTWSSDVDGRQGKEIKFQLSFKQYLGSVSEFVFYGAYTQKSFWQMYDQADSRPFRETNYNPEIYVRFPEIQVSGIGGITGFLGYEHESNGAREPTSRSWDRLYLQAVHQRDLFKLRYKTWYRLPEKEKEKTEDTKGDENPDIIDFYGRSEVSLDLLIANTHLVTTARRNFTKKQGALQVDWLYPLPDTSMSFYLQYWKGYGESLIDYNRHLTKLGVGVIFAP